MKSKYERYLIIIWHDLSIETRGPFKSDAARDKEARSFRHINGDEHGIHWMDVEEDRHVEVGDFSGGFFEEE
jgi:hypothetical protein